MQKRSVLKIVNILLAIGFLLALISMLLYRFIPSPLQGMDIFYDIHVYSGPAFAVIALIHIVLNWNWIRTQYFKKPAKPREK